MLTPTRVAEVTTSIVLSLFLLACMCAILLCAVMVEWKYIWPHFTIHHLMTLGMVAFASLVCIAVGIQAVAYAIVLIILTFNVRWYGSNYQKLVEKTYVDTL